MKKFKFKLQTLLDIREAREREIQYELARIISLQNREREKQADLRRRIEEQKIVFRRQAETGRLFGERSDPVRALRRCLAPGH